MEEIYEDVIERIKKRIYDLDDPVDLSCSYFDVINFSQMFAPMVKLTSNKPLDLSRFREE
jgi:hypothetical protein